MRMISDEQEARRNREDGREGDEDDDQSGGIKFGI